MCEIKKIKFHNFNSYFQIQLEKCFRTSGLPFFYEKNNVSPFLRIIERYEARDFFSKSKKKNKNKNGVSQKNKQVIKIKKYSN